MRLALAEAERAPERVSPNPLVGCVLVKAGRVVGRGFTRPPGGHHAEIEALGQAGTKARGATAYVTLEPCNHLGRTGPCSEALIAAGIERVVCGVRDPNTIARGGLDRLKRAKVAVESGVLEEQCTQALGAWLHYIATGRPRVTLKAAITLDGRLAARGGDSKWISGEASRLEAHRLRHSHDAILVGARTVALDDPALTARIPEGRDPQRVILDGKLRVPQGAQALRGAWIFAAADAPDRQLRGEVVRLPGSGRVALGALLDELGRRGITSLLVEGGGEVLGQLVAEGLADELVLFVAAKLIGAGGVPLLGVEGPAKMGEAWALEGLKVRELCGDLVVSGRFLRSAGKRGKSPR
jgi:diaminohydroxyphosphoribosylaminopyrimidine deaminase/5-amino-6-(5-phosphoribosylamino)uracil reductase